MLVRESAELKRMDGATITDRGAPELVVEAPLEPRRQPAERLANVERLRIIAMLEIVTFHVAGSVGTGDYRLPLVGGLGLPIFLLLNNAFNTTLSERMGTRAFLDVKVTRLVLPWLIWCAIYAAVVTAEKLRHHESVAEAFPAWTLIAGTYDHLWFVPFALFGSLLIASLQMRTRTVSHRRIAAAMLAAGGVIVLLGGWIMSGGRLRWPAVQWVFAFPSPLLGFALGRVLLSRDRGFLRTVAALLVLTAAVTLGVMLLTPVWEMPRRYIVSLALVTFFFLWPGRPDPISKRLTPLLFGVYLTHPLLVRLYQGAHLPEYSPAVLGVLIFVISALLVEGLRRSPLRRQV